MGRGPLRRNVGERTGRRPADQAKFADKYGVRYEILDQSYLRRDLTMWFAGSPVDEIVDVICAVLGAQCSVEADLIRIGE